MHPLPVSPSCHRGRHRASARRAPLQRQHRQAGEEAGAGGDQAPGGQVPDREGSDEAENAVPAVGAAGGGGEAQGDGDQRGECGHSQRHARAPVRDPSREVQGLRRAGAGAQGRRSEHRDPAAN
eukprot:768312-Hanusia_phi.AAC.1